MYRKSLLPVIYFHLLFPPLLFAQKINLDRPLNTPLFNEKNPSVSGDGRFMILETDYGNEKFYPVISKAVASLWTRPEEVLGISNPLTHDQHWNLNYDGSEIFFTSTRFGGIGQADIWISKKNGTTWSAPVNSGKPLNSGDSEMYPSISADGRKLYFVKIVPGKAVDGNECGKIYYAEKSGNSWKEPVALPSNVSSGNEASPRILNDNRTLIFASSKPGGKGKFDLYRTQLQEDNTWSAPVSLEFLNTDKSELFANMPNKGDFLFLSGDAKGKEDIFKVKVPDSFKPLPYLLIKSSVKSSENNDPVTSRIVISHGTLSIFSEQLYNNPDGSFTAIVSGNASTDLTVYPLKKGYFFKSFRLKPGQTEIPTQILLTPLKTGNSITLDSVFVNENFEILSGQSELEKIVKLLKDNPTISFKIGVSVPGNPGTVIQESPAHSDSLAVASPAGSDQVKENTMKRAQAIVNYLKSKGTPAGNLEATGLGMDQSLTGLPETTSKIIIEVK